MTRCTRNKIAYIASAALEVLRLIPRQLSQPRTWTRVSKNLDEIDLKILSEIQADGRITNVELAKRVGISPPPCLRRVRTLEEAGYIQGYRGLLDPRRLGFDVKTITNARYDALRRALIEFGQQAQGADIAVIFFAAACVALGVALVALRRRNSATLYLHHQVSGTDRSRRHGRICSNPRLAIDTSAP